MQNGPVISLVNLGCSKNTVDSEHILGGLVSRGFLVAEQPSDAEIVLINTCGFIEAAREESIETILELAELKSGPRPVRALVALGCMVERYREELEAEIPEVDAWVGFADYDRLPELCARLAVPGQSRPRRNVKYERVRQETPSTVRRSSYDKAGRALDVHHEVSGAFLASPRLRIGPRHTAHLKISEGCDHPCTFCAIPRMRGGHRSRPIEWLLAETERLVETGAREIVLIAQDTTAYGRDLFGRFEIRRLIERLLEIPGYDWLRLMYAHPAHLKADLMDLIAADNRICRYLDLPVQHIDDEILRRMRRGTSGDHIRRLIDGLKRRDPSIALRSTLIVGYPGETDAQFQALLDYVESGPFDHLGVFAYSIEEGTPAAEESDPVPAAIRQQRRGAILSAQQQVAFRRLDGLAGQSVEILVDAPAGEGSPGHFIGRTEWDALEIDGLVMVDGAGLEIAPGAFVRARITARDGYDLCARAESVIRPPVESQPARPVRAGYEV